jgi:hypothetical protein
VAADAGTGDYLDRTAVALERDALEPEERQPVEHGPAAGRASCRGRGAGQTRQQGVVRKRPAERGQHRRDCRARRAGQTARAPRRGGKDVCR